MSTHLDESQSYGTVRDIGQPEYKYVQNGLYYNSNKELVTGQKAPKMASKVKVTLPEAKVTIEDVKEPVEKATAVSMESLAPKKPERIIPKSGKPYKTEDVAYANITRKKLAKSKYTVVPFKEGFAIVPK